MKLGWRPGAGGDIGPEVRVVELFPHSSAFAHLIQHRLLRTPRAGRVISVPSTHHWGTKPEVGRQNPIVVGTLRAPLDILVVHVIFEG